jgi:hypothetical protein
MSSTSTVKERPVSTPSKKTPQPIVVAKTDITCQRGSARQCCKSHMPFKGKSSFLTPAIPKTIHEKKIKIGTVHNVYKFKKCAKFQLAIFWGSAPAYT